MVNFAKTANEAQFDELISKVYRQSDKNILKRNQAFIFCSAKGGGSSCIVPHVLADGSNLASESLKFKGKSIKVKYGNEKWGFYHIFTFIRKGDATTRAQQIINKSLINGRGEVVNSNSKIVDLIKEIIETGSENSGVFSKQFTASNGSTEILKVITRTNNPPLGSVVTITFR